MKAHQNRNMNYDEMHDYGMFNEAAHPARGNLLSICYHKYDRTVLMLNERKVSVQIFLQFVLAIHGLFPLLEGRHLVYQASSDEAHGAVYSASGSLRHHGSGVLAKLRRECWVLTMDQSQRSRTHWDRTPSRATNSARGRRNEIRVLLP